MKKPRRHEQIPRVVKASQMRRGNRRQVESSEKNVADAIADVVEEFNDKSKTTTKKISNSKKEETPKEKLKTSKSSIDRKVAEAEGNQEIKEE